jgi:hypothetical protein
VKLPWSSSRVSSEDATRPVLDTPEPIRLIVADEDLSGWIRPGGERVTDLLHAGGPLAFLPVTSADGAWIGIDPAELQLVVPPPHASLPERRVQRQRHEVVVRVGRWAVTGTAHLMPGEEYDPYLRSTRQFLPVTGALLSADGGPPEALETVIVNLKRVDEFRVV